MTLEYLSDFAFAIFMPFIAALCCLVQLWSARFRQIVAIGSSLILVVLFTAFLDSSQLSTAIVLIPGLFELNPLAPLCGFLFNLIYLTVFIAFGKRIFSAPTAAYWLLIQGLLSLGLLCDSVLLFFVIIVCSLLAHIHISSIHVYQTSKREDRFLLIKAFTFASIVLCALLLFFLNRVESLYEFSVIYQSTHELSRATKIIASIVMMILLGAFPLHSWVKPLFAAPARYGLAVITRLNIGFVVWCKLYMLIFAGDQFMYMALTFGCGANLLYAAFLLFGEHKLSQIVAALYLFHVPLLILAVHISGNSEPRDIALDFANITISISGLLIILGMLRDRIGAESLDRASGLAISYPFLGIAFLFCLLSLIGFPGTLGFLCSELILHHFAESTWPVAVAFIFTLALNGYSSFRIFGESFYGSPEQTYRKLFQPLMREKIALSLILLFLFLSGIGPGLIEHIQHLAH
jgi:NADH-quinone oxidoreductase subunit M